MISNVPGPQFPLYLGGAELAGELPGVGDHRRDGAEHHRHVVHAATCDFGILADRDQMPDVWKLIGWLREGLEELEPA